MTRKLAIIAVLLVASSVWGQQSIDITVPTQVAIGTLVEAKIADLGDRTAAWIALEPLDLEYRSYDGGASLVFASACGKGRVILLVTVVDWDARKLDQKRVIVKVGTGPDPGPGPGPGPDPEPPPPPPGKRRVVVLAEEDHNTAYREIAVEALREYVRQGGHTWKLYDPDQHNSQGQTPPELLDYLKLAADQNVKLPALVVIAEQPSGDVATIVPFPEAGTTTASARAAGDAAIKLVKEAGG